MKEFNYKIKDAQGIHARPAGLLVKQAIAFQSDISILKDGKSADLKKIFGIMGLGAKQGDEIIIKISGMDEQEAYTAIQEFVEGNL
jgi:phosphocarrier protein HPr